MASATSTIQSRFESACNTCHLFLEKHPTAWLFAHSLVAVTGGILVWIGIWDLFDTHLWNTNSIGREIIYLLLGFILLIGTNTYLSVAGVAKPQPTPGDLTSSTFETDKQDHLLWASVGSDENDGVEEQNMNDDTDRMDEEKQSTTAIYNPDGTLFDPALSPTSHSLHNRNTMKSRPCSYDVVVYVYLRSFGALIGVVLYWIGMYNIWDLHILASVHVWRDIIYIILGILVLLATETFLGEAGLEHQQQVITRQQLELKPDQESIVTRVGPLSRAHVMVGIPYIPSLYTIYKSHQSTEYSALATSMEWKSVAWIYGKAGLALLGSVWYWVGAWNTIHQIIPDGIGREILFIVIGVLLFILTNMMALAAGVQTAQQQEQVYQQIVERYRMEQRATQQHNSGLRGVSTQRVNVYEPSTSHAIDPDIAARIMIDEDVRPSSTDIDPYTGKCTRPIKLLYTRCGLAMLGGMLYWIGWYNSLMYEQRDSASDAKEASFWRDIMYVAVGLCILIVTNTLFSFTGALSPHNLVKNDVQTRWYRKRRIVLNNRLIMMNQKMIYKYQQRQYQSEEKRDEGDEKHGGRNGYTNHTNDDDAAAPPPATATATVAAEVEPAQTVSSFVGEKRSSFVTIPLSSGANGASPPPTTLPTSALQPSTSVRSSSRADAPPSPSAVATSTSKSTSVPPDTDSGVGVGDYDDM